MAVRLAAIIAFIVGMILGNLNVGEHGTVGRIIFAGSFMLFCYRILHLYKLNRMLGPRVLMFEKMV